VYDVAGVTATVVEDDSAPPPPPPPLTARAVAAVPLPPPPPPPPPPRPVTDTAVVPAPGVQVPLVLMMSIRSTILCASHCERSARRSIARFTLAAERRSPSAGCIITGVSDSFATVPPAVYAPFPTEPSRLNVSRPVLVIFQLPFAAVLPPTDPISTELPVE